MFLKCGILAAVGLWVIVTAAAQAAAPNVLVTVRPIHSLVAAVMDGVGTPGLLLESGQTPHSYTLAPSDAKALSAADIVVWVGEPLETFLEGPLETLASDADIVELIADDRIALKANRDGGIWRSEDDHEEGETHADDDHDHDHDHGHVDGHIWLDPNNARAVIAIVVEALSNTDPKNAVIYADNANSALKNLSELEAEVLDVLGPVKDRPFLVAHDALQYFDRYFELNAVGAITVTPDRTPSARRLSNIRESARQLGSVCLFSEPGFEPKVMRVVAEAADIRTGVLDPLGAELDPGKALYFDLMRGLALQLANCLGQNPS